MKNRINLILILTLLYASLTCHFKSSDDFKEKTHEIICNSVHVRQEPNMHSKSLYKLKLGQKVEYLQETFYKELIPMNKSQSPEKWYLISYLNESKVKQQGWVYSACLSLLPQSLFETKISPLLFLSNRHLTKADCPLTADCVLDCNCDCCSNDWFFMENGLVIIESFCCCDNPFVYEIGTYAVQGDIVTCKINSRKVIVHRDIIKGIDHEPIYEEDKSMTYNFNVSSCANGILLLHEKSSGELATFTNNKNVANFIIGIKNRDIYQMLIR